MIEFIKIKKLILRSSTHSLNSYHVTSHNTPFLKQSCQQMIFLFNGIMEAIFGVEVWFIPHKTMQVKKVWHSNTSLGPVAQIYARKLGPLILAFGIMSVYMEFEPFSKSKALFTLAWILYHVTTVVEDIRSIVASFHLPTFFHTIMHILLAAAMIRYLYQNQFNLTFMLLSFDNISDLWNVFDFS